MFCICAVQYHRKLVAPMWDSTDRILEAHMKGHKTPRQHRANMYNGHQVTLYFEDGEVTGSQNLNCGIFKRKNARIRREGF